jgi:signal transduction histidine kinase
MDSTRMRIVPWVTGAVHAIVGLSGLYYVLADLGGGPHDPWRTTGFCVGIAVLAGLDLVERRSGRHVVAWLLVARLVLIFGVVALDESSLSRVLFVLVPFGAYLTFGRAVGLALGGLSLVLLVTGFAVWVPGWYRDANYVADLLMFGMGLLLALAVADVARGERRQAARVASLSAETERNRLARDIHDSLGHHLTAISIQLEKASAFGPRDPDVASRALADARRSARLALAEVRASVGALRAPVDLVSALTELTGADASLEVAGDARGISRAVVTTLYRAAQEALTNARRHAGAGRVSVAVTFGSADTRLVVTDDGRGFDPELSEGFGLLGLRERAALVGGTVEVSSRPGAGTRLAVTVPR